MQGGWTPFMMAVWHGHYTAAETLLKMGNALVDAENEVTIFPFCLPSSYHLFHHRVVVPDYAWLQ